MALSESQNTDRPARAPRSGIAALVRAWLADASHHRIAQKVAGAAFMIRVVSAALIYSSQILFARWMGSFEFGIYVYVWTWVLLIGDICDLGFSTAAQRFIPEYTKRKAYDLLRGFLARSRWIVVGSATATAAVGAGVANLLAPYLPDYVVLPLTIACATLPFYALMGIQDGIARSYNWINLALVPPYVARHLLMLGFVATAYLLNFATDAVTAVAAVVVSFALIAVVQTIILNRKLARTVGAGPKAYEVKTWFSLSLPILLVEGFYVLLTNTDVLVLQHFRSPDEVAVYYAAAKTLTLIVFVHFAVSAAVAHRFAEYSVASDHERLKTILADSIRWTFFASLAATVVILAMGRPLLSLFGARFVEGYQLMFFLTVGLLARASVGPVERLLSMLGEQRVCAMIYASTFALNLTLCIVLIPRLGMDGAAISTSIALVIESILLFWVTKVRLGFHVFVFGGKAK